MQERDVLDLILVVILGVVTYVETFGLADPLAALAEIVEALGTIDVKIYLVLGGVVGIFFLGYLTIYLPQKDASRPLR